MKHLLHIAKNLPGFFALGVLIVVLVLTFSAIQKTQAPSFQATQAPRETQRQLPSPPSVHTTLPAYPPLGKGETHTAVPTPVGSPLTLPPYPAPEQTMIPPSPSPSVLPPLPPYPLPSSFHEMRLMYTRLNPPGYFICKADGTGEAMLPPWWSSEIAGGWAAGTLRIAPDGSKILYSFSNNMFLEEPTSNSIWTTNLHGGNKQLLVAATQEWLPEDAIWSPDGKQIAYRRAYLKAPGSGVAIVQSHEIWVMDADGGNQRLVTADPSVFSDTFGGQALVFRWLNNGYIYYANHDRQLYAVNPQSGQLYRLMDNVDASDLHLAISPDGKHVVASPNTPAQAIAYAGLIPIEIPGNFLGWSGDGKFAAYAPYATDNTKETGLWIRDMMTGDKKLVTSDQAAVAGGFSPDGRFFAYQTDEGIFVWDFEKGEAQLIVKDVPDPATGAWTIRFVTWVPVP